MSPEELRVLYAEKNAARVHKAKQKAPSRARWMCRMPESARGGNGRQRHALNCRASRPERELAKLLRQGPRTREKRRLVQRLRKAAGMPVCGGLI